MSHFSSPVAHHSFSISSAPSSIAESRATAQAGGKETFYLLFFSPFLLPFFFVPLWVFSFLCFTICLHLQYYALTASFLPYDIRSVTWMRKWLDTDAQRDTERQEAERALADRHAEQSAARLAAAQPAAAVSASAPPPPPVPKAKK